MGLGGKEHYGDPTKENDKVVKTSAASVAHLQSSHLLTIKCNLEKSQPTDCILL